jgi:hypothetical protein
LTFAWQGFQLEHPEDWAPALISGNRDEGYVRIASPDNLSYQIRWKRIRDTNLRRSLDDYLAKLKRDASKLKIRFQSDVVPEDGGLAYRWTGAGNGRGKLVSAGDRTFFLEASSTTNRSTQGSFRDLDASFVVADGEKELWSVFGISLSLRTGLEVERQTFQSGRTRVEWKDKVGRIVGERWGFGEQILGKHPFEEWARQTMDMEKAKVRTVEQGLELELSRLLSKSFGLARFDSERNQLVTLKSVSRTVAGRVEWDWLI